MNQTLRTLNITRLRDEVEALGPSFEAFCGCFLEHYFGQPFDNRGLSMSGHPVGGAVDGVSVSGDVTWEASTESGYFQGRMRKFWGDVRHALQEHGGAKRIVLLASARMPAARQRELMRAARHIQHRFGKELELLDGRLIATKIIDVLLDNDRAVDRLSGFLPSLRDIQEENAWSHGIPRLAPTYIPRAIEADLETDLQTKRVAIVSGIGGAGKSQVCTAIARRGLDRYESVIWLDASGLGELQDLASHAVNRLGIRRNLLSLLQRRSCLLVLDDLRFDATEKELGSVAGQSHLLVSRRTHSAGARLIPPLDQTEGRKLLAQDVPVGCPEEVFRRIWSAVGGHPLSLALLNASARSGVSWQDLGNEADAIGSYIDGKEQSLADRLLARILPALRKELDLFRWCGTPTCDRGFAKAVLGTVGIRKLEQFCLLAADEGNVLRLHDVVFASIQQLDQGGATPADFSQPLADYIGRVAHEDDDALVAIARTHTTKLHELVHGGSPRRELRYGWIIGTEPRKLDPALVGDPFMLADECRSVDLGSLSVAVDLVMESVEALYRRTKDIEGLDGAKRELEARLPVFDVLDAATASGPSDLQSRVAHHRGKALKLLDRLTEARSVFEGVLSGPAPTHAARLQLIRLYMKEQPAHSEQLIREVLHVSKNTGDVSTSVLLAVIKEIRRLAKSERGAILGEYGGHIAERIRATVRSHPDEALGAFAAVASHWAWNEPSRFLALWRSLPPSDPEAFERDDGRAAYADAIGEAAVRLDLPAAEREKLQVEALALLDGLKRPRTFNLQSRGKLLVQMGRFDEAVRQLEGIKDPHSEPWIRYWLAKARLGLGQPKDALQDIEQALSLVDEKSDYRATFLSQRAACRSALGDQRALEDMACAIAVSRDERHQAKLQAELQKMEAALLQQPGLPH